MTEGPDLGLFQRRLAERRAAEEAAAAQNTFDPDLVPDAGSERSEQDQELDQIIDRVGIIEAYNRWCGKSQPKQRGKQHESIMVSCPKPSHPDKNPSAWLNSEKNTWFCGTCQEGGDQYDIAAYNLGFDVPGYKDGAKFHELRRRMAETLGYTFIQPPGIDHPIPVPPDPVPPVPPSPPVAADNGGNAPVSGAVGTPSEPPAVPVEGTASVTPIPTVLNDDPEEELAIEFPTLNWQELMVPDTFLDTYMRCTYIDDVPEEYHFWNGLLAISLAIGREISLYDRVPVLGNLFICLLGHTGDGKSRSFSHLRRLLVDALPHKWDDPNSKGTRIISTPASAEVLIHNFSKPVLDPTNPKIVSYYAPIRGLIEFNELSALTARTSRMGNALKPALMEFYDGSSVISTSSMSSGTKEAWNSYGCAFTTTQPRSMRDLIRQTDADSGFLNRWIFASGKPKAKIAIGGHQIDVKPAVDPLQKIFGWSGMARNITWDDDAAASFTDFFHGQLHPIQQADETGILTRMDLTLKKVILLLTANQMLPTVPLQIVEKAISMYNYMVSAYAIPSAQIGNTVQLEIQDEILRQIKNFENRYSMGPTYRELGQRIKHKKYNPEIVHKMLKIMTDMGLIEATQHKGVGRPSVRYRCAI